MHDLALTLALLIVSLSFFFLGRWTNDPDEDITRFRKKKQDISNQLNDLFPPSVEAGTMKRPSADELKSRDPKKQEELSIWKKTFPLPSQPRK